MENVSVMALDRDRLISAKRAFSTRRVPVEDMKTLVNGNVRPAVGDLVLARVQTLGYQRRIELPDGRRAHIQPGQEIVVAYGNRYAPDQFEAMMGETLDPCELIAVGGIASQEISRHGSMQPASRIIPMGLIGRANGSRLNLRDYAIPDETPIGPIAAILVAGTAMNAGKTTTAGSIVYGLKVAGHRVAGLKITGTAAGGDLWLMRDFGADFVADFTDVGFPTTYKVPAEDVERGARRLLAEASRLGCEYAVIEIADGLQQEETAAMLRSKSLLLGSIGVVFAAYDALGAKAGVDMLMNLGHRVLGVSGKLTQSPLARREAEQLTGLSTHTPADLQRGSLLRTITGPHLKRVVSPLASGTGYLLAQSALGAPA